MNIETSTLCLPPQLSVPCAPSPRPGDWQSLQQTFADSPEAPLMQGWRAEPEEGFAPALTRVVHDGQALWILAQLTDHSIVNPKVPTYAPFFLLGDTFEVFLRPENQDPYFEFHVSPENHQFQWRFPSAKAFANPTKEAAGSWPLPKPTFASWTIAEPAQNSWQALVKVPFPSVIEEGGSNQEWLFSFSRYDYTAGKKNPIISSTSPHEQAGFHRQHEWGRLIFQPGR